MHGFIRTASPTPASFLTFPVRVFYCKHSTWPRCGPLSESMPDRDMLLDSTLDSVETAEAAVLSEAQAIGFGEEELHQLGMAVRESMVNAVVHGNRYNARKKVHVFVTKGPARLPVV